MKSIVRGEARPISRPLFYAPFWQCGPVPWGPRRMLGVCNISHAGRLRPPIVARLRSDKRLFRVGNISFSTCC